MKYIRLMTFNVQLLPSMLGHNAAGAEAEMRAYRVADAILDLAPSEQPDLITFNEVFNEDGREILDQKLSPIYPHKIIKLDAPVRIAGELYGEKFEDSGLAVYSKYQFIPLPPGPENFENNQLLFSYYKDTDDNDEYACKGIGIVRIECPLAQLTIGFTHTQAYYKFANEYRDVREKQLGQIADTFNNLLGQLGPDSWQGAIIMGDLNIKGDPGATPGNFSLTEYDAVFNPMTTTGFFSNTMADGWRTHMLPPGLDIQHADPGITNNNIDPGGNGELPAGLLSRLDYQCFYRSAGLPPIVPQHMRTRFRNLSDHWSLESDIHLQTPHCTPASAYNWKDARTPGDQNISTPLLDIQYPGSYQWVYVDQPGTYTVFPPAQKLELAVFAVKNLSDEWKPYPDKVKTGELGIPGLLDSPTMASLTAEEGWQYAVPGPFLIRIRGGNMSPNFSGKCRIKILRHTGQTPQTAITLHPWVKPLNMADYLPQCQPNGPKDECWLRVDMGRAWSGEKYITRYYLNNPGKKQVSFGLYNNSYKLIKPAAIGPDTVKVIRYYGSGPEKYYLRMARLNICDVDFEVGFQPNLTYLRSIPSVRPMVLRCMDETGADWAGGDEIVLKIFVDKDSQPLFDDYWDDADANEIWKLEGHVPEIAFAQRLRLVILEEDNIIQEAADETIISALAPSVADDQEINKPCTVQDGTYRFECVLSRSPQ